MVLDFAVIMNPEQGFLLHSQMKVAVLGGYGFVGHAFSAYVAKHHPEIQIERVGRQHCDISNASELEALLRSLQPSHIVNCAAILSNSAQMAKSTFNVLTGNIQLAASVAKAASACKIPVVNISTSYLAVGREPREYLGESELLAQASVSSWPSYVLAKRVCHEVFVRAGIQFGLESIMLVVPNLYGPVQEEGGQHAHLVEGITDRFLAAKREGKDTFEVWGSGEQERQLLHVFDLSSALIWALGNCTASGQAVNVSPDGAHSVLEIALLLRDVCNGGPLPRPNPEKGDGATIGRLDTALYRSYRPTVQFMSLQEGLMSILQTGKYAQGK